MKISENDIQFTNKSFIGSGGFSEYYYTNGGLAIGPVTNIEFLNNGKFIGINSHDLKFIEYIYDDGKITSRNLDKDEVQNLYPDYTIIKISDFKDNKITLYKQFLQKKKFLLFNDTDKSFYKYSYKPERVNPSYIKTFITVSYPVKIIFSHYGEDTPESPALTIYIKDRFYNKKEG